MENQKIHIPIMISFSEKVKSRSPFSELRPLNYTSICFANVSESLYRICLIRIVRYGRIYLLLLSLSVLEEVSRYLREQSVGQYIFLLL